MSLPQDRLQRADLDRAVPRNHNDRNALFIEADELNMAAFLGDRAKTGRFETTFDFAERESIRRH